MNTIQNTPQRPIVIMVSYMLKTSKLGGHRFGINQMIPGRIDDPYSC